ncbi:putative L-lactate dehydrogenase, Fe-S oxidoreductase subunit YkgE, partial [Candidatus Burkholderia humilis]
AGAAPRNAS